MKGEVRENVSMECFKLVESDGRVRGSNRNVAKCWWWPIPSVPRCGVFGRAVVGLMGDEQVPLPQTIPIHTVIIQLINLQVVAADSKDVLVEKVSLGGGSGGTASVLDLVLVVGASEEVGIGVDIYQKEVMEQPYVICIVDVQPIAELKVGEEVVPLRAELAGDINPKPLDADVMYTPMSKDGD